MNLSEINWFENVGKPIAEQQFEVPVKCVSSKNECIKHINSRKWENLILSARNRLSWYIQSFHKEESRQWNSIADQAHAMYATLQPVIIKAAARNDISNDILIDVKSILICYFIEQHYFNHLDKNIPIHFDKLIHLYAGGHIPCGWNGTLPVDKGYEPLNFDAGKILVW
jgi:hypothetical protein